MKDSLLPIAVIVAALGVMLSFCTMRTAARSIGLFVLSVAAARAFEVDAAWESRLFTALWISTILTAALVYVPRILTGAVAILAGANAGLWAGAAAGMTNHLITPFLIMAIVLICIPGAWLVRRGGGIAVKVVASWIIAVGVLAAFVSTLPTPGYAPDHME